MDFLEASDLLCSVSDRIVDIQLVLANDSPEQRMGGEQRA